jgi:hypothetical protein
MPLSIEVSHTEWRLLAFELLDNNSDFTLTVYDGG